MKYHELYHIIRMTAKDFHNFLHLHLFTEVEIIETTGIARIINHYNEIKVSNRNTRRRPFHRLFGMIGFVRISSFVKYTNSLLKKFLKNIHAINTWLTYI